MTEQEKRNKLFKLTAACWDLYDDCNGCPIKEGSNWCDKYNEATIPEEMLDDVLAETIAAFGDVELPKEADMVNHPPHYCREGAMETIEEMEVLFGANATFDFCRLNAWKYRARANAKNGQEDMEKSDWYIRKAAELKAKMKLEGNYERRTESI